MVVVMIITGVLVVGCVGKSRRMAVVGVLVITVVVDLLVVVVKVVVVGLLVLVVVVAVFFCHRCGKPLCCDCGCCCYLLLPRKVMPFLEKKLFLSINNSPNTLLRS